MSITVDDGQGEVTKIKLRLRHAEAAPEDVDSGVKLETPDGEIKIKIEDPASE